jgi:hypothetical protein
MDSGIYRLHPRLMQVKNRVAKLPAGRVKRALQGVGPLAGFEVTLYGRF